jgi:hypothetical protein
VLIKLFGPTSHATYIPPLAGTVTEAVCTDVVEVGNAGTPEQMGNLPVWSVAHKLQFNVLLLVPLIATERVPEFVGSGIVQV